MASYARFTGFGITQKQFLCCNAFFAALRRLFLFLQRDHFCVVSCSAMCALCDRLANSGLQCGSSMVRAQRSAGSCRLVPARCTTCCLQFKSSREENAFFAHSPSSLMTTREARNLKTRAAINQRFSRVGSQANCVDDAK